MYEEAHQGDEYDPGYEEAHQGDEYDPGYEECGEPITKAELAPWIRENEWDKVDIDAGDYHLTAEPINFIPDTRSGKLSAVAELSQAGLIPDPTMTADLFDEPDIARANRSILGPKHWLDHVLESLADPKVPMLDILPDQFDNLELGLRLVKGELKEAQANRATDDELERYREWIAAAKVEMSTAKAGMAPPAPPPMPGMDPMSDPGLAGQPGPLPGIPMQPGAPGMIAA